jgi:hypothetical protein
MGAKCAKLGSDNWFHKISNGITLLSEPTQLKFENFAEVI